MLEAINKFKQRVFPNFQIKGLVQFDSFMVHLLNWCGKYWLQQSRQIIIEKLFSSKYSLQEITDFQTFSFGSAAINAVLKTIYNCSYSKQKQQQLVPMLKYMLTEDLTDTRIPSRLKEGNMGYMRIMKPELSGIVAKCILDFKQIVCR